MNPLPCARCGFREEHSYHCAPGTVRCHDRHDYVAPSADRGATCARCGALEADHLDYGRAALICPTTSGGTFQRRAE